MKIIMKLFRAMHAYIYLITEIEILSIYSPTVWLLDGVCRWHDRILFRSHGSTGTCLPRTLFKVYSTDYAMPHRHIQALQNGLLPVLITSFQIGNIKGNCLRSDAAFPLSGPSSPFIQFKPLAPTLHAQSFSIFTPYLRDNSEMVRPSLLPHAVTDRTADSKRISVAFLLTRAPMHI